jgi:hypothetical protein
MPPQKVGKPPGPLFLCAFYISRDPGELSGRADSLKIGVASPVGGGLYISRSDSYIEMTSAGAGGRLAYIKIGKVYI